MTQKEHIITGYYSVDEIEEYEWFIKEYAAYTPDAGLIEQLKKTDKNIFIQIFAGSWCSDTHILLPRFYKVASMAGLNNHQVYFLDRQKSSPDKLENEYNIEWVPTFIVIENGVEKGRIVEKTKESIEKDLLHIITTQ